MQREASSHCPSFEYAIAKCINQNGKYSVEPVASQVARLEVMSCTRCGGFSVKANEQLRIIIPNAFHNAELFSVANATSSFVSELAAP
jgi:hypothetical protein